MTTKAQQQQQQQPSLFPLGNQILFVLVVPLIMVGFAYIWKKGGLDLRPERRGLGDDSDG